MNQYERYWKEKYDKLAVMNLEDWQKSHWWDHRTIINQRNFMLRQIKKYLPSRSLVADIGCGPGVYCRTLSDLGYKVVGLDYSRNTVIKARGKNNSSLVYFSQADANNLPLRPASFDVVLAMGILQLADDPAREIAEMHSILKPGGKVILTTPIRYRTWELPFFPVYCLMTCDGFPGNDAFPVKIIKRRETVQPRPSDPQGDIIKRHPLGLIKKQLREAGFEDIKVEYPGRVTFLPYLVNSIIGYVNAVKK